MAAEVVAVDEALEEPELEPEVAADVEVAAAEDAVSVTPCDTRR